jgi:hypothetical protein
MTLRITCENESSLTIYDPPDNGTMGLMLTALGSLIVYLFVSLPMDMSDFIFWLCGFVCILYAAFMVRKRSCVIDSVTKMVVYKRDGILGGRVDAKDIKIAFSDIKVIEMTKYRFGARAFSGRAYEVFQVRLILKSENQLLRGDNKSHIIFSCLNLQQSQELGRNIYQLIGPEIPLRETIRYYYS